MKDKFKKIPVVDKVVLRNAHTAFAHTKQEQAI